MRRGYLWGTHDGHDGFFRLLNVVISISWKGGCRFRHDRTLIRPDSSLPKAVLRRSSRLWLGRHPWCGRRRRPEGGEAVVEAAVFGGEDGGGDALGERPAAADALDEGGGELSGQCFTLTVSHMRGQYAAMPRLSPSCNRNGHEG